MNNNELKLYYFDQKMVKIIKEQLNEQDFETFIKWIDYVPVKHIQTQFNLKLKNKCIQKKY